VIDTHCHLLPGLDDGPNDERDAVALARSLVEQGVTDVLCTPHYAGMFPTRHTDALQRHEALRARLDEEQIPLRTSVAAEVGPSYAATQPQEELEARSIAGRYLLVEVVPDSPLTFLQLAHERLGEMGLLPVFGHPERCRALRKGIGVFDSLRQEGALVQVVAPSLLGRWGPDAQDTAWRLVDTGRADLLASDAHSSRRRRPHLREVAGLVAERLSEQLAVELTVNRPAAVLRGESWTT
jgi:protein-tyrosine phosphatase